MGTPLSVRAIESMRPGDKPKTDAAETQGLRVTCAASGAKTFIYRYRSPETGKLVQMKLGQYPALKLAEARLKVVRFKEQQQEGICPKAALAREQEARKRAEQEQERERQSLAFTVAELVETYLTEVIEDRMVTDPRTGRRRRIAGARKPKGQAETRRTLYNDAVRVLGHMPAVEVGRQHVVGLIKGILDRGARVQAGAVLRELTAAYDYALAMGKLPDDFPNPALLAKSSLKSARVKLSAERGRRALADDELRAVLAWLPGSAFSPTQKHILLFALWTGCRTGEICEAEWADIDLDAGTWHLKETKNQASRYVQLSRQAVEYLRPLKRTSATYVFPSMRTGEPIKQKSLSETKWFLKNPGKVPRGARLKPEQCWLDNIPDWSPHDLRRTVRTGLSRLGCPNEVAEAVLGHSRQGIEGTYDLHHYESECREWLQKWADHLDTLV